MYMHTYSYS